MQSEHFREFDADDWKKDGSLYGIWTRVAAVKGRCPRPLDEQTKKRMWYEISLLRNFQNKTF